MSSRSNSAWSRCSTTRRCHRSANPMPGLSGWVLGDWIAPTTATFVPLIDYKPLPGTVVVRQLTEHVQGVIDTSPGFKEAGVDPSAQVTVETGPTAS